MAELQLDYFYRHRTLNFAHRGARLHAPENTLPAFQLALEHGADGIEFDVQLSADGIPVVIHDSSLQRTTDGSGSVADKTLAELKALDAGRYFSPDFSGVQLPTLEEVFEALGEHLLFNVELKGFGRGSQLAEAVVALIRQYGLDKRVLISSFNPANLINLRRLAEDIPIGYLYTRELALVGWAARLWIGSHEAQHPHYSIVSEQYMAWARKHHYRVNVWTVNEADDIRRMCSLGVDGIITDDPERTGKIIRDKA